jgi:hypothetical protein
MSWLPWRKIITSASMNTAIAMVEMNLVRLRRASDGSRISRPRITSSSTKYFATSNTATAITT